MADLILFDEAEDEITPDNDLDNVTPSAGEETNSPVDDTPDESGEETDTPVVGEEPDLTPPESGDDKEEEGSTSVEDGKETSGEPPVKDEEEAPSEPPSEDQGEEETPPEEDKKDEDDGVEHYTGTQFSAVYNRFLGKITDDMHMELTPEDTIRDLQNLLIDAIPGFEFPRVIIDDYEIKTQIINEADVKPGDFILAVLWHELPEDTEELVPDVLIENSCFKYNLTTEEINILALLMKVGWVQRQVSSIENIRMKYSGTDFKMTSQANHLSKLLSLLSEAQRESLHMQRLYKRRKVDSEGRITSNWSSVMEKHVFK